MLKSKSSIFKLWMEFARLILCDIGNTSFDFYRDGIKEKIAVEDYEIQESSEKIFYICVNETVSKQLQGVSGWIDLEPFIDRTNYYETMGIDRIVGCEAVENGVIIDAGSAITVDVVKESVFQGGYITLGLHVSQASYKQISPRLAYSYNFEIDLDKMPKNSQDAITYGQLGVLYRDIVRYDLPIYLMGGDAQKLKTVFQKAYVDEDLLFKGMKKIMKKAHLC